MRLWHYKLIPVLPKQMLVSQWRECIAIKRQWEMKELNHRLVNYVKDYDRAYFNHYVTLIVIEMEKRKIKYQEKYHEEINRFCSHRAYAENYPEHNARYLTQCYYNLQEKYDRGIITEDEFRKIEEVINK